MKNTCLSLLLGLALVGCSNDEFEPASPVSQSMPDVAVDADAGSAVTKADLQNVVSIFGNGSKENSGRSQSDKDYTLSTIYDSEGSPAIYVINYAGNGGFVLVSATKDYHPILAYAERGNYDVSRFMSSGLDVWEESTINAVKESASLPEKEKAAHNIEWLKYSAKTNAPILRGPGPHEYITDEEYAELTQIYMYAINDLRDQRKDVYPYDKTEWCRVLKQEIIDRAESLASNVYWMYEDIWQDFATLVYWYECEQIKTPVTVQSTWAQDREFNSEYRPLASGLLPAAGCGPVAAGQIMRYFQHPVRYNWQQMPLDVATSTTSKFLFDIAETAGAIYGSTTSTEIRKIRDVFVKFGYSADNVKAASFYSMAKSIESGSPVYVRGDNGDKGHAWVATQSSMSSYTLHYDIYNFKGRKSYQYIGTDKQESMTLNYLYYNWGWGGYNDGYFAIDDHQYNKDMEVILNIKPK